jgi:DNA ligase-1
MNTMSYSNAIYRKDASGEIRIWYYELGTPPLEGHYRTISGLLNGNKITSSWTYCPPRSQDTAADQAYFNAESLRNKKLKMDYKESVNDIDEPRHSFIKSMNAQPYVGWEGPCYVQPKLDGMRCLANKNGLWSRLNNRIISVPHIEGALKEFFNTWPHIVLDGELYNHELYDDFNTIMSLTKKTKPSMEDLDRSRRLIEYWIFDMFDMDNPKLTFSKRWGWLIKELFGAIDEPIVKVLTQRITSEEQLSINFMELLQNGYEGQMVRYDMPYDQKRSSYLLKRKEMQDEEFRLIDIEEGQGNWTGYAKIAICETIDGKQFGAGISGTQEFNAKLLREKKKYQAVTIKYQALTPDGVPRFGIATKFWEKEFDDLEQRIKPKKDLFS